MRVEGLGCLKACAQGVSVPTLEGLLKLKFSTFDVLHQLHFLTLKPGFVGFQRFNFLLRKQQQQQQQTTTTANNNNNNSNKRCRCRCTGNVTRVEGHWEEEKAAAVSRSCLPQKGRVGVEE